MDKQKDKLDEAQVPNIRSETDYDPYIHREVVKPTNNFETFVHLVKATVGTGILAMPQAFQNSGLIMGIIGTIVIGLMVTHCINILVRTRYKLCKYRQVPILTYPQAMSAALEVGPPLFRKSAKCSAVMVDVFLVTCQIGICCVYTLFIAEISKQIFDYYYVMSIEVHLLIILAPIIAANCIRNLKFLAPFCAAANALMIVALGLVIYYVSSTPKKTTAEMDFWGSFKNFPLFFGTTVFAIAPVVVAVTLENHMKTPQDFTTPLGVLNTAMAFIIALYVTVGVVGYRFCVDQCRDAITLDMDFTSSVTKTVLIMYAIAIVISYVLQCYVPVEIFYETYLLPYLTRKGSTHLLQWEYAIRIGICLFTFLLALTIPRLGLFISLFGALCLSTLGVIFPVIMQTFVVTPNFGPGKYILFKNIIVGFVGFAGMVIGTLTAITAIVKSFGS